MTEAYARKRDTRIEDATAVARLIDASLQAVATLDWVAQPGNGPVAHDLVKLEARELRAAIAVCRRRGF